MSWVEWWWRIALTARIGGREHRAAHPWRISLTTTWPRALLQCLFFTLLGRVVGGEAGQAHAFIGSVAIAIALYTIGEIGDVPMRDRWSATFYRLRRGRLPVPLVYAVRAWPILVEAAGMAFVCVVVVGIATRQVDLTRDLIRHLPIYLLLVGTSAATGLAAGAAGLFGRAGNDVIVGNLGIYLIIASSGAIIPLGTAAWLDRIGSVLPMQHGLQAIRLQLVGDPWRAELVAELAVGIGWALLGWAAYAILAARVRRTDHDKVT